MSYEESRRRIREILERAANEPLDDDELADLESDEWLAAVEDGHATLADASAAIARRAIRNHGFETVVFAEERGRRRRGASREPAGTVIPRERWFRHRTARRLALVSAAAAAVIVVVLQRGRGNDDVRIAWVDRPLLAPEVSTTALEPLDLLLRSGEPGWDSTPRGDADDLPAEVRRQVATIHFDGTFACATWLDRERWLVTSSSAIAGVVQEAALRGEVASVDVQRIDVDDDGRAHATGDRASATVARHAPGLGLSLLRLDDPISRADPSLARATVVPTTGSPLRILATSSSIVAGTEDVTAGEAVATRELFRRMNAAEPARTDTALVLDGSRFSRGTPGAPVLTRDEPPQLVGVVLGGDGSSWCSLPAALEALLSPLPSEPEPFPVDPWAMRPDASRWIEHWSDGASPERSTIVVRTEAQDGTRTLTLFGTSRPLPPGAKVPGPLPGDSRGPDVSFDVALMRTGADRRVLFLTGGAGVELREVRVAATDGSAAGGRWIRGAQGLWRWEAAPREGLAESGLTATQRSILAGWLGE